MLTFCFAGSVARNLQKWRSYEKPLDSSRSTGVFVSYGINKTREKVNSAVDALNVLHTQRDRVRGIEVPLFDFKKKDWPSIVALGGEKGEE